jgi:hypothetical protein
VRKNLQPQAVALEFGAGQQSTEGCRSLEGVERLELPSERSVFRGEGIQLEVQLGSLRRSLRIFDHWPPCQERFHALEWCVELAMVDHHTIAYNLASRLANWSWWDKKPRWVSAGMAVSSPSWPVSDLRKFIPVWGMNPNEPRHRLHINDLASRGWGERRFAASGCRAAMAPSGWRRRHQGRHPASGLPSAPTAAVCVVAPLGLRRD